MVERFTGRDAPSGVDTQQPRQKVKASGAEAMPPPHAHLWKLFPKLGLAREGGKVDGTVAAHRRDLGPVVLVGSAQQHKLVPNHVNLLVRLKQRLLGHVAWHASDDAHKRVL